MNKNNSRKACAIPLAILLIVMFAGGAFAQIPIGGEIFTGAHETAGWTAPYYPAPPWTPIYDNPAAAPPLIGAQVMVQNQHSGGAFIAYGTVTGNSWTATVPVDGDYVIMFSAPGHDMTSREVEVFADGTVKYLDLGLGLVAGKVQFSTDPSGIDAYLPKLHEDPFGAYSADELPTAGLLVFAFYDFYVNGEPDDPPEDLALNGVTWTITDEDGAVLATGVTGSQATITLPDGTVITNTDGLYYFTGLPPGEVIATSDASTVTTAANPHIPDPGDAGWATAGTRFAFDDADRPGWYLNYTEEGGKAWDPKLLPGDHGLENGGYLIWHGYVEKLDQLGVAPNPNPSGSNMISGTLRDADGAFFIIEIDDALINKFSPGVTANVFVPDGLIVLFTDGEATPVHPVATVETGPTPDHPGWSEGYFEFTNVPDGGYKMMIFDLGLDFVWVQQAVTVAGGDVYVEPLVPRFFARAQGYVYDNATGLPVAGATVHTRLKDGSIWMTTTTSGPGGPIPGYEGPEPPDGWEGWYNFDNVPEVEVLGYVDVELPDGYGYRGAMKTDEFYSNATFNENCEDAWIAWIKDTYGSPNPGDDPPPGFIPTEADWLHPITCDPATPTTMITLNAPVPFTHNAMARYVQWYTANYRADLYIEPIPAGEGDIRGFVYNDQFDKTWVADGVYDKDEERTMHGVTVELYDATGTTLLATTTTGKFDKAATAAQGWNQPYTWPLDEWGGVFTGPLPGYYEFRGLTPGTTYKVKVIPPSGFTPSSLAYPLGEATITVVASTGTEVNFGVNTMPPGAPIGVPLAGEIEGGVFDDVNVDNRIDKPFDPDPNTVGASLLKWEKAGIPGAPVGVYDQNGYLLGAGYMGNPVCFVAGTDGAGDPIPNPICPGGEDPFQKPEMERRFASGVHLYYGNDPKLPGTCPSYIELRLPYTFGQGKFKFEADWSLFPAAVIDINNPCNECDPLDPPPICGPWKEGDPIIWPEPIIGMLEDENAPVFGANTPQQGQSIFDKIMQSLPGEQNTAGGPLFASASVSVASGQPWISYALTPPSVSAAALAAPLPSAPITLDNDEVVRINGANFGDDEGYSRVTLAGENLKIKKWRNTYIDVLIDVDEALQGAIVVATTAGLSNGILVDIHHKAKTMKKLKKRSVWVDVSNSGAEDGSKSHPWNTIAEALEHLPDTKKHKYVYVAPGSYYENILIKDNNLHLIGSGPRETVIHGNAGVGGPVIYIGKNEHDDDVEKVTISGFTITGGSVKDDIGAGIFSDFYNHDININTNAIYQNGGYYGGGIWMHNSNHSVRIHSNIIAENGNYGGYGGGISVCDEPEDPNEAEHTQPEHIVDDLNPGPPPGTYKIYNNLIYHNYSPDYGGAIALYEVKDKLNVFGNVMIENNSEDHGGAMFFEDCGPVDLYANVFLRNYCYDDGGAVSFEDVGDTLSHVNVYNNLFAQNIADDRAETHARGGALAFDDTFYARVYNNTFVGNIVAGTYNPAGGAIDSERNGHEYNGADGPYLAPGYSDPEIYNNIIYGNWKMKYVQPGGGEEDDLDYTWGKSYTWTPDEIHVDNPALQEEWESHNNSESFTVVHYNDIRGGYSHGSHNMDSDPGFVNPSSFNWHLEAGSPVIDQALYKFGSPKVKMKYDIEDLKRSKNNGMIDMGASEWRADPKTVIRIPLSILGKVTYPAPGTPSPNDN